MRLNARVWSMHHTQKFSIAMSVPHLISIANWTNNNGNTVYKTHTRTCVSCYSIFVAVATAQRCQIYENAGKNKMLFLFFPHFIWISLISVPYHQLFSTAIFAFSVYFFSFPTLKYIRMSSHSSMRLVNINESIQLVDNVSGGNGKANAVVVDIIVIIIIIVYWKFDKQLVVNSQTVDMNLFSSDLSNI